MEPYYLEPYLVKEAPKTVFYIPNFITPEEEEYLLGHIYNAPKPKWTCLGNRRLQDYGGIPHKNGLIPESIPSWLQTYLSRISDLNIFVGQDGKFNQANHCLVNEYEAGQGIMPHFDGPIFTPIITTLSIGSHTMLEFYEEEDGVRSRVCKLLLERNSLVILEDDMYAKYLHGISETSKDVLDIDCLNLKYCGERHKVGDTLNRATRISLTIRNVPKVFKCNLFNLIKK